MFKKIQCFISKILGIDESKIKLESSFKDDLGADSIEEIMLLLEMETEFQLEISDEEAIKFKTVQDVITYIEK